MCLMASGSLLPSIDHLDNKVDKNVLYYSYEWYKEFYNLYSELGAKLFVQLRSAHVLHPYTSQSEPSSPRRLLLVWTLVL